MLSDLAPVATAHYFRGTITGVVKDAQGAAVPAVNIKVRNLGTNVETTVTTEDVVEVTAPTPDSFWETTAW